MAQGLSCSETGAIFPDRGSNPSLLHWQAASILLSHHGSPFIFIFDRLDTYKTLAYHLYLKKGSERWSKSSGIAEREQLWHQTARGPGPDQPFRSHTSRDNCRICPSLSLMSFTMEAVMLPRPPAVVKRDNGDLHTDAIHAISQAGRTVSRMIEKTGWVKGDTETSFPQCFRNLLIIES